MKDVILKRVSETRCPICGKELTKDYKIVAYEKTNIMICSHHPYPKEK